VSETKTLAIASPTVGEAPSWFYQNRRRIAAVGIGHSLYATFCWFFDHVLYVYVIYQLGILVGGAIMTAASVAICVATLVVYERMGTDWVGGGLVKDVASKPRLSIIGRVMAWASHQRPVVMFLTLCALFDPFITTAYFRAGAFDGLRKRDWQVFFVSVLVSNLWWIFVADLIGHAVAATWTWITRWI